MNVPPGRRFLFLLGSGASRAADVPMMGEITERILSGDGVYRYSDGSYHLGKAPSPPLDQETREHSGPIRRFAHRLKSEIDRYYNPDHHTSTYEDIHFLASQVHDAIVGEYENPAILALLDKLSSEPELLQAEPQAVIKRDWALPDLAKETAEYIHDIVRSLLAGPREKLDILSFLVDGCRDLGTMSVTIATLNHDTVLEQILENSGIEFTDGFGSPINEVRYFDPMLLDNPLARVRVLKLHGSVNWYRLRPDDGSWVEDRVGIFETHDWYHTVDPDGRLQIPEPRPMLLIGTFNKALSYTNWFFSELFSQFQQSLKTIDTLVICGYGFGDKGINSQITQWIPKSQTHRVVVMHPNPEGMRKQARGAIQRAFDYLEKHGRLHLIPKKAAEVSWQEITVKLHSNDAKNSAAAEVGTTSRGHRKATHMKSCYILGAGFSKAVGNLPLTREIYDTFRRIRNEQDVLGYRDRVSWGDTILTFIERLELEFFVKPCVNLNAGQNYERCNYKQNMEALVSFIDLNLSGTIRAIVIDPSGQKSDFEKASLFWNETNLGEVRSCMQTYLYLALIRPEPNDALMDQFTSRLRPDDSVIMFNYDLLVERELYRRALWNPRDGYGIQFEGFPEVAQGQEFATRIPVYKLHGSLNWEGYEFGLPGVHQVFFFDDGRPIFPGYLKNEAAPPGTPYQGKQGGCWMMPSFVKEFSIPEFLTVWDRAAHALRSAERVVVVGYSLHEADSAACVLLGTSSLSQLRIAIVNPSAEDLREKYERVTGNSRIVAYRDLNDFLDKEPQ